MTIAPITLEGVHVTLAPLSLEHHSELCEVGLDESLWQQTTLRIQTPDDMLGYIQTALNGEAEGTALPFVIRERSSGRIVGSTRYHSIEPAHRRLEIGFTWIAPLWQRTCFNTEIKHLMLRQAFEEYGCVRVQFKAAVENEKSRRALLRIGAKEEGVLRQYIVSGHRGVRDVVMFSILDGEWPEVKAALESRLSSCFS